MGSLTKMWTAAHVVQFAAAGALSLDAPFAPMVDSYMVSESGQTTEETYGSWIAGVTVRELLTMRSGLPDYDDSVLRNWTFSGLEYSPFDVIRSSSKEALFAPGQGGAYSSIGYVFLGLVLANLTKAEKWSNYDQRSVLPSAARGAYPRTVFPMKGLCGEYDTAAMFATDSPSKVQQGVCEESGSLAQLQSDDWYGRITSSNCSVAYGSVDAR